MRSVPKPFIVRCREWQAGHSVGMGNSVKELFDVVEHRTTDIEDDGISNALKYYNLI